MGLLDLTRRDESMRKIFGKRELEIIEKQLLGVGLSSSEKTRLSRDIRQKFDLIDKLSEFKKEFSLKKGSEIKYFIEEAKEEILKSHWSKKIKKIVLFGSFVKGEARINSDIDLAVEFDKISLKEATKFRIEMSSKVNSKISLQVYNILPEKIKQEIKEGGRVIYGKS